MGANQTIPETLEMDPLNESRWKTLKKGGEVHYYMVKYKPVIYSMG